MSTESPAPLVPSPPNLRGVIRIGRRTKELVRRLRPGEIAVIAHRDLDGLAAQSLAHRRPAAVINACASSTGRYPNPGPRLLLEAGIPILDEVGEEVLDRLRDGEVVEVVGEEIRRDGEVILRGSPMTKERATRLLELGRARAKTAMVDFARNTLEHIEEESEAFLGSVDGVPLRTQLQGRPVLVVARAESYLEDLRTIRTYVEEVRPVILAVDGAADGVIGEGLMPHVILGDMDSVSEDALACGAELVAHAYPDGRCPSRTRLEDLGLPFYVFPVMGTSEDAALILAEANGADLIVLVGGHLGITDFLERGREGMASTFLTRLKLGGLLVDARGVSRLYRGRVPLKRFVLLAAAGSLLIILLVSLSPFVQTVLRLLATRIKWVIHVLSGL